MRRRVPFVTAESGSAQTVYVQDEALVRDATWQSELRLGLFRRLRGANMGLG